jgi:hypothetical protein
VLPRKDLMKTPGQVAYEAYFNHSSGKSLISGDPLPAWSATSAPLKAAWEAAATAVLASGAKETV